MIENKELKSFLELLVEYSSEIFRIRQAKGKEYSLEFSKMIMKALQNDASRQGYIKFFRCIREVSNICLCLFDGNKNETMKEEMAGKRSKGQWSEERMNKAEGNKARSSLTPGLFHTS